MRVMSNERIHIDAYWRSLIKKSEELCGDRVQIKRNDTSVVMVLADGLGSGVKANILSTLTSTIICEMVYSGMNLKDAIETISATLPVCADREIAYSTFTIIQVYYDGAVFIAQYDNPSVVYMHEGKVIPLEVQDMECSNKTIHLMNFLCEPGDYIFTFSDGVLFAGLGTVNSFGWGQEEVEKYLVENIKDENAYNATRILLNNVNELYDGKPGDDSTVSCLHIIEPLETRIMVGPPLHKEDDKKVVERLLEATGKKVCCGGTTSTIVSRETGKELKVDLLLNLDSNVPPKGSIEGIDLVTEGVLTLQKVSRIVKKILEDTTLAESVILSTEQDGATCLARILIKSSAITFMVGLSDNPTHEAIAYSTISLNAKIALIEDIAEDLKKLGKIVRIEMY